MNRKLRILQVSTMDMAGGAEQVAMNLHRGFRSTGHEAWLAVGYRRTEEPGVLLLDNEQERSPLARAARVIGQRLTPKMTALGGTHLRGLLMGITDPARFYSILRGYEDFSMPATRRLLEALPQPPDIVHCHNLHGSYFDLREVAALSRRVPVLFTLHDMWAFTGHCAYSFGCERWRDACGACPDLRIYPPIRQDGTKFNLRRKRKIYQRSRLYVASPSRWLMDQARSSVLAEGMVEAKVIPYGVDLCTFGPARRGEARKKLGISPEAQVLLYATNTGIENPFKDYATVQRAAELVAERLGDRLLLLVVGGPGAVRREGRTRFVPYVSDRGTLADYYRAADLFLHAAHQDNYPNTVLESLACGTPVVATATGGIPEQIDDQVTGCLVPPREPVAMAGVVLRLLSEPSLRRQMGDRAAEMVRRERGLERQVATYLTWFCETVADPWAPRELDG